MMETTHHPVEGVVDPVCGMTIDPADAVGQFDYKGRTYYFCAESCLEEFRDNPEQFLDPAVRSAPAIDLEAEYTCPMHPEVRQRGPGPCPICGMALEPVEATLDEEPNHELIDMSRRFWWSLVLTTPILAFMVLGAPRGATWIELALASPVVLWGGWPFFVRGWASIVSRHLNMFTLIALGVGAAFLFSVVATIAPALFPESFRVRGQVGVVRVARFGVCSASRRRRRARSRRGKLSTMCRSSTCTSAIACACGPVSASRWTVSSSTARPVWTNRW
jgi:Cu+-exporting ATPase